MDIYDPQTLGFMVFGGFMVISAIGIVLVSTFSMKETSYEEALAKQRKEQEKHQPKSEKKKKEKLPEKGKAKKKKEDKPNGKIPESEPAQETVSESEPEVTTIVPEPAVPEVPADAPRQALQEPPAPSPKDKKKKEKKVAKVEPAPSVQSHQAPVSKSASMLEAVIKEVPVMAVPPVGAPQSAPVEPAKRREAAASHDDAKQEGASKKKSVAKKKAEPIPADSLDGPLYLPYKTLVSTMSSMVFSEGEAQRLIEILTDKTGIVQDTWHTATQKGDPVTALKRQLEEKEKQLSAEQEDATAAKNKLRELTKELAAEKTKVFSVESKLKEQLGAQEQEITAVKARMQASYQDHVTETQQLQTKIRTLQEQLENGPNAQLARLQQENSILRDALNQATSQTESKQNAELAKLRQECTKLTKDLSDQSEALQQDEQQRKALEAKVAAFEKQISQLQSTQQDNESTLQKRLDEVSEELRKTESNNTSLLSDLEKAKKELKNLTELQAKVSSGEAELKSKWEEVESLKTQLTEANAEKVQLEERIRSIETLLEAGQSKESEKDQELQLARAAETEQLQNSLKERDARVSLLEKEILQLKETVGQQANKNNDLREKNWKAMEALSSAEKLCEKKLGATKTAKDNAEQQLCALQKEMRETLQALFPEISVATDQTNWLKEFKQKAQEEVSQQTTTTTESPELALKLKEAEESQNTLQAECDQYRSVLAETEGMLKDLQKSVEEEELVWKAKLAESEEELKKAQGRVQGLEEAMEKLKLECQSTEQLKEQVSLLEAQLENQLEAAHSECQNYSEEVSLLRVLLSESQSQLEIAKSEVQKQSEELALVRQHLSEMMNHVQDGEAVESQTDQTELELNKFKSQLEQTVEKLDHEPTPRQKPAAGEFDQKFVSDLQAELVLPRAAGDSVTSDSEDVTQLKDQDGESKEGTSV
ncbi:ribosome-binding protein 1-like isoform X1 [Acipenser ruthenus]|uniref:ribosome-binding protein 1-like isoform X1 n=1 Tax=Acipenser ruthenus TaxID=7906 RepID=UPI00145B9869|nr:ribosome-binding protein 1-like isoform X1 [Acipenser ruthenus]XP_058879845.1 ribosome-binding protein 1-like isoform X1 [Acipenser ruthenus]